MLYKIKQKFFKHFIFFNSELGSKIYIGLFLSIIVGFLDGLGLAMFFPLLQMVGGKETADGNGMENLQFLTDLIENAGFELTVHAVLGFIVILFILKGIAKFIEGYYSVYVLNYFVVKLRQKSLNSFANYSFKSFIKADTGQIQNTLSNEVGRVAGAYKSYFMTIQNGVFVLIYLLLAFLSNSEFALFVVAGGILSSVVFISIYNKTRKLSSSITHDGNHYQGLLIQMVTFYKYLKSTGRFLDYSNKLWKSIFKIERSNIRIGRIQAFLVATREPLVVIMVVLVILLQITYFGQNIQVIFLSLLFFYRALNVLVVMQGQWINFLAVTGSMENMQSFLEELDNNKEQYGSKTFEGFKNELKFNAINFGYKINDTILKNINISIKKNTTVAFIGESGSGKTTLVNILTGLLPINGGSFKIDGIDAKEIDMRTFQNSIGYITQEPVIFDDNVFNNVTFWDEKSPENLIRFWEALRKASILDFVESLPEKENAPLGNNGIMVSGGQKQRLSIARELYKDIDILIMDEATSALDSETERAIQENIDALKGQYTIIIIAHRLSTIKNADEIVLMSKGEIIDKGSFSELIESNETFKRMVNLQEL